MYTLQREPGVRDHQMRLWMHIIYYHCFMNHIYSVTAADMQSSDIVKHPDQQSNRSLNQADIQQVLKFMKLQHYAMSDDESVFIV